MRLQDTRSRSTTPSSFRWMSTDLDQEFFDKVGGRVMTGTGI